MRIGMHLPSATRFAEALDEVVAMEAVGADVVWCGESYGFDAVSAMGAIAVRTERVQVASGILPVYSRTPALLAMTAAGVDALSAGRCVLGLGASGPQVIEGWHGVPYDAPVARTREVVQICRAVWRRERVEHPGPRYPLPLPAVLGTGLGKPLKLIHPPLRERIPVFLAAIGAANVALTAEIADGWLPTFFWPERAGQVWGEALERGAARRDPALGPLEVATSAALAVGDGDEVAAARDAERAHLAHYIGGMGARDRNYYNDMACRYGYVEEAAAIQDLYLAGRKAEAAEAVPDDLVDHLSLVGTPEHVARRVAAYREAGVTVLNVRPHGATPDARCAHVARLRELVAA